MVPPLLILKTNDLQHDSVQSLANNRLIRKVAEMQGLVATEGRVIAATCYSKVSDAPRVRAEFLNLVKNGGAERRSWVPPLLILKTKDLQHDPVQSRANN